MSEFVHTVVKSVEVLCDYIAKMQQIELDRYKIATDFAIAEKKITVLEKVALEQLYNQRLVLEEGIKCAVRDLESLNAGRGMLISAIEKLALKIASGEASGETQTIALRGISILREEVDKIRKESEGRFHKLSDNIIAALQSPLNENLLKEGGENGSKK